MRWVKHLLQIRVLFLKVVLITMQNNNYITRIVCCDQSVWRKKKTTASKIGFYCSFDSLCNKYMMYILYIVTWSAHENLYRQKYSLLNSFNYQHSRTIRSTESFYRLFIRACNHWMPYGISPKTLTRRTSGCIFWSYDAGQHAWFFTVPKMKKKCTRIGTDRLEGIIIFETVTVSLSQGDNKCTIYTAAGLVFH